MMESDAVSEILDNAVDSLEFGIGIWLHGEYETAPKHAILNIFHAVELLLKERLFRVHYLLIYKNIDKPISDESNTVGLEDVLARFYNLDIALSDDDIKTLRDLKRRRNRIEHHIFKVDPSHKLAVGKALKFIYYFLRDHLGTELEDVLSEEDIYNKVSQEIFDYEEQLCEALREVALETTPKSKDDLVSMPPCGTCPDCGNETIVIGSSRGDYCFLCREEKSMEQCPICEKYVGFKELESYEMCANCEERRWAK